MSLRTNSASVVSITVDMTPLDDNIVLSSCGGGGLDTIIDPWSYPFMSMHENVKMILTRNYFAT